MRAAIETFNTGVDERAAAMITGKIAEAEREVFRRRIVVLAVVTGLALAVWLLDGWWKLPPTVAAFALLWDEVSTQAGESAYQRLVDDFAGQVRALCGTDVAQSLSRLPFEERLGVARSCAFVRELAELEADRRPVARLIAVAVAPLVAHITGRGPQAVQVATGEVARRDGSRVVVTGVDEAGVVCAVEIVWPPKIDTTGLPAGWTPPMPAVTVTERKVDVADHRRRGGDR